MAHTDPLAYLTGFGNELHSEALPGALPVGQNSPQRCPYGLYAEQISGTPFTAPRAGNRRAWLYRIRPSVLHGGAPQPVAVSLWRSPPAVPPHPLSALPLRWDPVPVPPGGHDFIDGMRTVTVNGDVHQRAGAALHLYLVNAPMQRRALADADGELLVVPQLGALLLHTEFGVMRAEPGEVALIPRGVVFRVEPLGGACRGYVCENFGAPFTLPELGPIGANGLASPRDFRTPVAAFDADDGGEWQLVRKFGGAFHASRLGHSPFDVVAWHGNHVPWVYDLRCFSPLNAVRVDHPDPSIFTVLTAPTAVPGTANVDFVVFPPRWTVAENTFRPPWYHRNVMSEFMGLIEGVYDARPRGFLPGGMSLHNAMVPHGPDGDAFQAATDADLAPQRLDGTLAFMFETWLPQQVTDYAAGLAQRQADYHELWLSLRPHFEPSAGP
jgi:homogentisate 1,2-dioxygenase